MPFIQHIMRPVRRFCLFGIKRHFASKDIFTRSSKPTCCIGTIGHYQHGKTSVTSAISKVQSAAGLCEYKSITELDKSRDEQARRETILLAHLQYDTEGRHYAHIDCPGHSNYVKQSICGINQLDAAILVVSAMDGCDTGTREQLVLAKCSSLCQHVVAFINKCDLLSGSDADNDLHLELVEGDVRELISEVGFDGAAVPVVRGSAQDQTGIGSLLRAMDSHITVAERPQTQPFLMCIERVNEVAGRGTVVSGQVLRGEVRRGDQCRILGYGTDMGTQVTSVQIFMRDVEDGGSAQAGDQHVSLLVKGVKKGEVKRGMMCAATPAAATAAEHNPIGQHTRIRCELADIACLPESEVNDYQQLNVFCSTWGVPGEVEMVSPGTVILHLQKGVVCDVGWTLTLLNNLRTVGCARITHILEPLTDNEMKERQRLKKLAKKGR